MSKKSSSSSPSKPARGTVSTAGKLPHAARALATFKENLKQARMDRGLSQSDVAREIWGTATDNRGYEVARNRDRISVYERGLEAPSEEILAKLSEFFDIPVAVLAPDLVANMVKTRQGVHMATVDGSPGTVLLEVYTFASMETAVQIIALLSKDPMTKAVSAKS